MILNFFSDPHLGLKRAAHTTAKSQKLYQKTLYDQALACLTDGVNVCLGDLFDQYSNPEDIIQQGFEVALQCKWVLAGNHDMKTSVNAPSSVGLLDEQLSRTSRSPFVLKPESVEIGNTNLTFVPHVWNQEEFVNAIYSLPDSSSNWKILCLHCNVGDGFGEVEGKGSSLWLTSELQDYLLTKFDVVLVGHEHEPKQLRDGRISILGNPFPVSYGEMADRFRYVVNTDNKTITPIQVFEHSKEYTKLEVKDLVSEPELELSASFVDISGTLHPNDHAAMARGLVKLWNTNPQLLAVRKSFEIQTIKVQKKERNFTPRTLQDVVKEEAIPAGFGDELQELLFED